MKLFKGATGKGIHRLRLDISQAFDTLSHRALFRFLLETDSCAEAGVLWDLCCNTSVDLQLGTTAWSQKLGRGILQGTSFSADVFSRILDFFLSGMTSGSYLHIGLLNSLTYLIYFFMLMTFSSWDLPQPNYNLSFMTFNIVYRP